MRVLVTGGPACPNTHLLCPLGLYLVAAPTSSGSSSLYHKGVQMVRLSGRLPCKSVGFISLFSLPHLHLPLRAGVWDPVLGLKEEGCTGSLDGPCSLWLVG